jgi:hypothetical protein
MYMFHMQLCFEDLETSTKKIQKNWAHGSKPASAPETRTQNYRDLVTYHLGGARDMFYNELLFISIIYL